MTPMLDYRVPVPPGGFVTVWLATADGISQMAILREELLPGATITIQPRKTEIELDRD